MSSVLLVDDEETVREVMTEWLASLGYEARGATDADEALRCMDEAPAEVAVCDITMPGRDGLWLAARLRALYPDTAVVMATGSQDVDSALNSLELGAVDYLAKPFTRDQLRSSMSRALEWNREAVRARRRATSLEIELRDRLAPLAEQIGQMAIASDADVNDLLEAIIMDRAILEHSRRAALISVNISLALGLRSPELSDVERAALLHDVGRHALPKAILSKPSALSQEEHAVVRLQPKLVHEILRECPFLAPAADIVCSVFERYDGTGYPWGLRGEEIPIGARIIAVADGFDAMTHQRLHCSARALPEALFEIQRCRGTQFDPRVVEALIKVVSLHWHRSSPKVVSGAFIDNPPGPSRGPQDSEFEVDVAPVPGRVLAYTSLP